MGKKQKSKSKTQKIIKHDLYLPERARLGSIHEIGGVRFKRVKPKGENRMKWKIIEKK